MRTLNNYRKILSYIGAGVIIAAFVIFFVLQGGQSAALTCRRVDGSKDVNCIKRTRLLWVIPLGTQRINSLRSAQVSYSSDYEGNVAYRVELITSTGIVPLTEFYTSGRSTKEGAVKVINTFLKSSLEDTFTVTEPGFFSIENLICFAIWIPVYLALNRIWGWIKS